MSTESNRVNGNIHNATLLAALKVAGSGVILTDGERRLSYANPEAERLTGWSQYEAAGRPIDEIVRVFDGQNTEPLEDQLSIAMQKMRSIKPIRPYLLIDRLGNEHYVESTALPISDSRGGPIGGVVVLQDVSQSREITRRMAYHATHDLLTGLLNRREFCNCLQQALQLAKTHEGDYSLCFIDVDRFKAINESCGYSAGDTLLSRVATLLASKIRNQDTLARLFSDKFAILLDGCDQEEAMHIVDTLRMAVGEFKFEWRDNTFDIGISAGVVAGATTLENSDAWLFASERACNSAKQAGGNRVDSG